MNTYRAVFQGRKFARAKVDPIEKWSVTVEAHDTVHADSKVRDYFEVDGRISFERIGHFAG